MIATAATAEATMIPVIITLALVEVEALAPSSKITASPRSKVIAPAKARIPAAIV